MKNTVELKHFGRPPGHAAAVPIFDEIVLITLVLFHHGFTLFDGDSSTAEIVLRTRGPSYATRGGRKTTATHMPTLSF